jgi:hypothetical protein
MKKQGRRGPAKISLNGLEYVTLTELSERTGRHICLLSRLVKQGRLPEGRVNGKIRYVPYRECLIDLLVVPERESPVEFLAAMEL